jgi:ABC-type Fe3+-siderophore transport system permease subunit
MSSGISFHLAIGLAVLVALIYLNRATRKKITPDAAGRLYLRMNNLYSLAGVTGLLIGLGLTISTFFRDEPFTWETMVLIGLILGIFWGAGIPCLLYYKNHRVIFDDTTITVVNVFGGSKTVAWHEITAARFKPLTGMITIYSPATTVKVHQHLIGLSHLVNKLTEKKGWTAQQLGIPW